MSDYDDEPTPELQPTDCTGSEDCPAGWHVHGCYEDGGGCTDPHEHVIAAQSPRQTLLAQANRPERKQ